jgi:hypothetical protein
MKNGATKWNRSTAIAIAKTNCTYCGGNGTRLVRYGREVPCNCAFRVAFRACLNRFRECTVNGAHTSTISLEATGRSRGSRVYSRKNEEYLADFCLVSRRSLNDDAHELFRLHFLLGADWRYCCVKLKIDRGTFFHGVYRIEQLLGRVFADLKPYALWPLDEYFGGTIERNVPLLLNTPTRIKQIFPHRLQGDRMAS